MSRKTTVRRDAEGRFATTIPKRSGELLELAGAAVSFRVDSRDRFSVIREAGADEEPPEERFTVRVSRSSRGQYQLVIPIALADAYRLGGASLEWDEASRNRLEVDVVERGGA